MQTNSLLVSFLASGLAAAGAQSYNTPVDCTPTVVVVAETSPSYGSPAYTAPTTTSTVSFEQQQYGSPSPTHDKPKEYTTHSGHVTVKHSEGPDCTTSSLTQQHTTATYKSGTKSIYKSGTGKMTPAATPTYSPVQSVGNHVDAQGLFIATVVAGLFFFM